MDVCLSSGVGINKEGRNAERSFLPRGWGDQSWLPKAPGLPETMGMLNVLCLEQIF